MNKSSVEKKISDLLKKTYGHAHSYVVNPVTDLVTTDQVPADEQFKNVYLNIWDGYSGGTTAAKTTAELFRILGREEEIDDEILRNA